MRFTAKTETLHKVVEVLKEIGAKEIDGFTSNVAQDIGEVLLKKAREMKQAKDATSATKEQMKETSKQISQGKAWKNTPG
jgi:CO dehydrogenase/acetyl-CoA synthase alpha subunit